MLEKSDTDVGDVLAAFNVHGLDVGLLVPTETALDKSIMDATSNVRDYLRDVGAHHFEEQPQGSENKRVIRAYFLDTDGMTETKASLYRPTTKSGDPRIWFYGLGKYAFAYNLLAFFWLEDAIYVVNASRKRLLATLNDPASPLGKIVAKLAPQESPVAQDLLDALREISAQGFITTLRAGDTGVGKTLENLLGIKDNSDKGPDFGNIELKARRLNKGNKQSLFTQVPNWEISTAKSAWDILKNYGYERNGKLKLYCTIDAKSPNSQGLYLAIDDARDRLTQRHRNVDPLPDDSVASWDLETLRSRLVEKHSHTFWVGALARGSKADEQFHYVRAEYTRAPSVRNFEALVEAGILTVDYLIKQKGNQQAATHKGFPFKIAPKNMPALFPPAKVYDLSQA